MFQTVGSTISGRPFILLAAVGSSALMLIGWAAPAAHSEAKATFSRAGSPDITAVVVVAGLTSGTRYAESPRIANGLRDLEFFLRDETARVPGGRETFVLSFALMAIVEANENGRYDRLIARTVRRLKAAQWDQTQGCEESDPCFGGTGYKPSAPPDLYHTSLAIEALSRAGVPAHDASMQRAVLFVSRCQSFANKRNLLVSLNAAHDRGGFSITPAGLDESNGEQPADDSVQPYGSLTCAGLKSLIYCGVSKEDDRVVAAIDWLRRNYTLVANPGMPDPRCRLYDYWFSLATAMTVLGENVIVDANNVRHDWRRELARVLAAEQQPDGCWLNPLESDSFREAHPAVTTSLALMTLSRIVGPNKQEPRSQHVATAPPRRSRCARLRRLLDCARRPRRIKRGAPTGG